MTAVALPWDRSLLRERLAHAVRQWWFPITAYVLTRLVGALFVTLTARSQVAIPDESFGYTLAHPSPASPGYVGAATNWDGQWYERIAILGYPTNLPTDAHGHVVQNEWAFYPVYPMLVRAVMAATGLGFGVAAVLVSASVGLVAVLVMHHLVRTVAGVTAANATVLLFCTSMAAPALQIAYTESLALLLVCATLLLLLRRRYLLAIPVVATLALTRPVVLALLPVIAWHAWVRLRQRRTETFPARDRVKIAVLATSTAMATALWPTVAALGTGRVDAYLSTMRGWASYEKLQPGTAWLRFMWLHGGPVAVGLLALIVVGLLTLTLGPTARPWGPELRAWATAYPLYLIATTSPGTSIVRYLLLAFPLYWPLPGYGSGPRERRHRLALVGFLAIAGLVMQWAWVRDFLIVSGSPAGRAYP